MYNAEVVKITRFGKSYEEQDFESWEEAGEWIKSLIPFGYSMPRVNDRLVAFAPDGTMYDDEASFQPKGAAHG